MSINDLAFEEFAAELASGISLSTTSYLANVGKMIDINFAVVQSLTAGIEAAIMTLPVGKRPYKNLILPAFVNGTPNGFCRITTSGVVSLLPTTTATYIGTQVTYIANN